MDYVSTRYGNRSHIIYDIYNEPAYISWNDWKPKAEELINIVRQNDPDNLILVSGVDFAYDLSGVKSNPISRNNIIYAIHIYPNRLYDEWDYKWGRIADEYPVMLTEWGYDSNTKAEHLKGNISYASKLMDYIGEANETPLRIVGWLAWCYDSDWEPNMLEKDGKLNNFGRFVKGLLISNYVILVQIALVH